MLFLIVFCHWWMLKLKLAKVSNDELNAFVDNCKQKKKKKFQTALKTSLQRVFSSLRLNDISESRIPNMVALGAANQKVNLKVR